VDVSATAKEAGITFPTFMNRTVWDAYVQVPPGVLFAAWGVDFVKVDDIGEVFAFDVEIKQSPARLPAQADAVHRPPCGRAGCPGLPGCHTSIVSILAHGL